MQVWRSCESIYVWTLNMKFYLIRLSVKKQAQVYCAHTHKNYAINYKHITLSKWQVRFPNPFLLKIKLDPLWHVLAQQSYAWVRSGPINHSKLQVRQCHAAQATSRWYWWSVTLSTPMRERNNITGDLNVFNTTTLHHCMTTFDLMTHYELILWNLRDPYITICQL